MPKSIRIDRVAVDELLRAQDDKLPVAMKPSAFEGTRNRKRQTRGTLPLLLHWRHCFLRGPIHSSHKWFADVLMSSQVFRANPHIVVAKTQCTGTQDSLVVKSTKHVHLQLVKEILHFCGVDKVHVTLEDWQRVFSSALVVHFAVSPHSQGNWRNLPTQNQTVCLSQTAARSAWRA